MSLEHAEAPLTLEPKNDYMKRKIEERLLAPNSIANGAEQVCAVLCCCVLCRVPFPLGMNISFSLVCQQVHMGTIQPACYGF